MSHHDNCSPVDFYLMVHELIETEATFLIHPCRWFIKYKHIGLLCKSSGDAYPLLLTA
ncbi:hypothetical protein D3C84_1246790 [compost metagenome]